MSYVVKSKTPDLQKNVLQKSSVFLRLMAEEVVDIARPVTPASAKNPRLKNDVLKQVLGVHVIIRWDKKYAAYQERGMRKDGSRKVRRYTTPGTGAHFAENSVKNAVKKSKAIAKQSGLL